jgi:hypothetical protein
MMARKARNSNFDQTLEILRGNGFEVTPYAGVEGGYLVAKSGAAAILAAFGAETTYVVAPGAFVGGQVARLLDRGYQKFLQTANFELPATAGQLSAIHAFGEELRLLVGAASFYNEALGSTSDLYRYDRLKGHAEPASALPRPWENAETAH